MLIPNWLLALVGTVSVVMFASMLLRSQPAATRLATTSVSKAAMSTAAKAAAAASGAAPATAPTSSDDTRVHAAHGGVAAPVLNTIAAAQDSEAGLVRRPRPAGIPSTVQPYRRTPLFTESTVPNGLLRDHTTRPEVWGLIHVQEGKLNYHVTDPRRPASTTLLTPDTAAGLVEPTIKHHVEPLGAVKFFVEFNREETKA